MYDQTVQVESVSKYIPARRFMESPVKLADRFTKTDVNRNSFPPTGLPQPRGYWILGEASLRAARLHFSRNPVDSSR